MEQIERLKIFQMVALQKGSVGRVRTEDRPDAEVAAHQDHCT